MREASADDIPGQGVSCGGASRSDSGATVLTCGPEQPGTTAGQAGSLGWDVAGLFMMEYRADTGGSHLVLPQPSVEY